MNIVLTHVTSIMKDMGAPIKCSKMRYLALDEEVLNNIVGTDEEVTNAVVGVVVSCSIKLLRGGVYSLTFRDTVVHVIVDSVDKVDYTDSVNTNIETIKHILGSVCVDNRVVQGTTALPFVKDSQVTPKPRLTLLEPEYLLATTRVLEFGANKYGLNNWKMCPDPQLYVDALYRHLMEYIKGNKIDSDTGESHLAHISANAMFLLHMDTRDGTGE